MVLNEPVSTTTDLDLKYLAAFLNKSPRGSIRLRVKGLGRHIRAELVFHDSDIREMEWILWILDSTARVQPHDRGDWEVVINQRKRVREVLGMVSGYLEPAAQERALHLIEMIELLDTTPKRELIDSPPERFKELMKLLR